MEAGSGKHMPFPCLERGTAHPRRKDTGRKRVSCLQGGGGRGRQWQFSGGGCYLDSVLKAVQLPAGITGLDTGLADVDRDNFTHCGKVGSL